MNAAQPTAEQIEAIRLRNLANIAEKAREGKTLSKSDLATLAGEQARTTTPAQTQAEREAAMAAKWGANARTVRRWKSEGAPIANDEAMPAWLRSRRKIPAGTATILAKAAGDARAVSPPRAKGAHVPAAPVKPGEEPVQGAAAALKRLEEDEAGLWTRLRTMDADPGADSEEVGKIRKAWLATGDALRRYELAVEQSRRDAGQLLPRVELEEYAAGLVVNFAQSLRASLENAAVAIAGLETPAAVWRALKPAYEKALREALDNAAKRPHADRDCPKWLATAVEAAAQAHLL